MVLILTMNFIFLFFSAYSSFSKQRPAVSNLQAMQETTVRVISFQQLNELYESSSDWYKLGNILQKIFIITNVIEKLRYYKIQQKRGTNH